MAYEIKFSSQHTVELYHDMNLCLTEGSNDYNDDILAALKIDFTQAGIPTKFSKLTAAMKAILKLRILFFAVVDKCTQDFDHSDGKYHCRLVCRPH